MDDGVGRDRLFSEEVLAAEGGTVGLSDRFVRSVDRHLAAVESTSRSEVARLVGERFDDERTVDSLVEIWERDPRSLAELWALLDHLGPAADDLCLKLLPALRLFRSDVGPIHGVPDGFAPVPADLLSPLSTLYSRALVYVWLDDCDPCDAMKRRLESVIEDRNGVALFAVYGPDDRANLARTYQVTAGPAVLFVRGGPVESRLYGAHDEGVLRAELDRLEE